MSARRALRGGVLAGWAVAAALSAGCSTMSNTEKGAGIGAALGTGAGLAVGAATGNPKTGAVVGGLLGAGTGAAVGNGVDRDEKRANDAKEIALADARVAEAQAQQRALGMIDVVQLAQQGHSEAVIVNQIRSTGSTFQLSTNDLAYLKANNVPDGVIVEMQNARVRAPVIQARAPRPVIVQESPTVIYQRPAPVYVYGPPPPPVGVGFVYHRHR